MMKIFKHLEGARSRQFAIDEVSLKRALARFSSSWHGKWMKESHKQEQY